MIKRGFKVPEYVYSVTPSMDRRTDRQTRFESIRLESRQSEQVRRVIRKYLVSSGDRQGRDRRSLDVKCRYCWRQEYRGACPRRIRNECVRRTKRFHRRKTAGTRCVSYARRPNKSLHTSSGIISRLTGRGGIFFGDVSTVNGNQ